VDRPYNNKKANDIPEDIGLGCLLRRSREERHIDLDEAVRATRIRRQNLEALENEEWSKLPSEVFVKGFLRSYAGFLGLDKEMVLNYYQKISPFQKYRPHVLKEISVQPRNWRLIIIISVLALGLIGSVIYLKGKNISIVGKVFQYLETQSVVEKREDVAEKEGNKSQDIGMEEGVFSEDQEVREEGETALIWEPGEDTKVLEEPATPREAIDEKPLSPRFVLTANVSSRTWIAIYIDDEPVKEYLFQPGDTIKWTANKGFDILVGNADGIEFLLNGKEVGHLGPEGKVVRLKLPEGI
jgi:cytoskeleton protein RodZ